MSVNFAKFLRTPFLQSTSGGWFCPKHRWWSFFAKSSLPIIREFQIRLLIQQTILQSWNIRSSRPEVFCKKAFVEILQNSQENTCASVPAALSKKRFWHRCFPVNFAKFLRTPFFIEHLWWLLLEYLLSLDFFIHFTSVLKQSPWIVL